MNKVYVTLNDSILKEQELIQTVQNRALPNPPPCSISGCPVLN